MANENPEIAYPQEKSYDYSQWMLYSEEEHFALVQEIMNAPKYTVRKDRLPFDGVKIKTYSEIVEERTREIRIRLEAERRQKELEEALRRQREAERLREIQEQNGRLAQIIKALGPYVEEKQRKQREQEELRHKEEERLRKEKEEKLRKQRELEELRRKQEERLRKEKEEKLRKQREQEELRRKEEERLRKEKQEKLRKQREQEEVRRKEEERLRIEQILKQRELEEAELLRQLDECRKKRNLIEARAKTGHILFHIEEVGVCKASGYLNGDGTFVIKRNSMFNQTTKTSFLASAIGASRQKFIKGNCIQKRDYYNIIWCTTIKDAQCKSAKVAASYMMGAEVDADMWVDEHGESIVSYYPQLATSKQETFLYTTADGFVSKGYYDKPSKNFVVCKGSQFLDIRKGVLLRKPMGAKRELFIKKNCDFKRDHYVLKRDMTFQSSSEAISYIAGEITFLGPVMWKNEEGKVLAIIFPEVE